MDPIHIQTGKLGENIAQEFLKNLGYEIIATNWRYKNHHEIDILIREDVNTLIAVEVRSLNKIGSIGPLDSISKTKIKQIKDALNIYVLANRLTNLTLRVDVIAIVIETKDIEHFKSVDQLFEL